MISPRKLWGLITVLCAGPVVPLGVVVWIARLDVPAYGITTLVAGLALSALGGLLLWLGRHPVPTAATARKPTTDLSGPALILDGLAALLN